MTFRDGTFKRTFRFGLLALFMCATCFALGIATERHFGKQVTGPSLAVVQSGLSGNQQSIEDLHTERDKIVADLVLRMKNDLQTEVPSTDLTSTLRSSYRSMQRVQDIDFEVSLHQKEMANRMNAYAMVEKQLMNRQ